jgi:hypothetical protein
MLPSSSSIWNIFCLFKVHKCTAHVLYLIVLTIWNDEYTLYGRAEIAQWYSAGLHAGWSGVRLPAGAGNFLFTTVSRPALELTHPSIQWVPGALSVGVKRPGHEADHLPPSSAEVKECVELYFHSPNTPSWRGAQLKHRDNFTFTLTFTRKIVVLCTVFKFLFSWNVCIKSWGNLWACCIFSPLLLKLVCEFVIRFRTITQAQRKSAKLKCLEASRLIHCSVMLGPCPASVMRHPFY